MGWGSAVAVSCGVVRRCCLDPAWLWLWCGPVATAPIQALAWEPPYTVGTALKSKINKQTNKMFNALAKGPLAKLASWLSPESLWGFGKSMDLGCALLGPPRNSWTPGLTRQFASGLKIFSFFFWPHSIQKFLGQGSDLCCSCDQCHS